MANQIVSFKYTFTFCMHLPSEDISVFKLHIIPGKAGHTYPHTQQVFIAQK